MSDLNLDGTRIAYDNKETTCIEITQGGLTFIVFYSKRTQTIRITKNHRSKTNEQIQISVQMSNSIDVK